MEPVARHPLEPDVSFDGGNMDCGNGLLLLIRKHIDPLPPGGVLEVRSREISVDEDLPAWCRLTGNEFISWTRHGEQRSFLICKGALASHSKAAPAPPKQFTSQAPVPVQIPSSLRTLSTWVTAAERKAKYCAARSASAGPPFKIIRATRCAEMMTGVMPPPGCVQCPVR